MKANGAKRKIFNDAIDLLDQMEEAAVIPENTARMLPAESGDASGETEAWTVQRDVVRTGVVSISVTFSVSAK